MHTCICLTETVLPTLQRQGSEGAMTRLETLIDPKFISSSFSSRISQFEFLELPNTTMNSYQTTGIGT